MKRKIPEDGSHVYWRWLIKPDNNFGEPAGEGPWHWAKWTSTAYPGLVRLNPSVHVYDGPIDGPMYSIDEIEWVEKVEH